MTEEQGRSLIAFWVSEDVADQLKELARKYNTTISDLLRSFCFTILEFSDKNPKAGFYPALWQLRRFESLTLELKNRIEMILAELRRFKEVFNK